MYFVLSTRKSFSSIWKIILVQIDLKGEAHRKVYFGVRLFSSLSTEVHKKNSFSFGQRLRGPETNLLYTLSVPEATTPFDYSYPRTPRQKTQSCIRWLAVWLQRPTDIFLLSSCVSETNFTSSAPARLQHMQYPGWSAPYIRVLGVLGCHITNLYPGC